MVKNIENRITFFGKYRVVDSNVSENDGAKACTGLYRSANL